MNSVMYIYPILGAVAYLGIPVSQPEDNRVKKGDIASLVHKIKIPQEYFDHDDYNFNRLVVVECGKTLSLEVEICSDYMNYDEGKTQASIKELPIGEYSLQELVNKAKELGQQRAKAIGVDEVFVVIKPTEPKVYYVGQEQPQTFKGPVKLVARDQKRPTPLFPESQHNGLSI